MSLLLQMPNNIILIGMPGSGKSTVGVQLAKHNAMEFMDTDLLIQTQQQRPLQVIVDTDGYLALRHIEEQVLLSIHVSHTVIATGGSAIYSKTAMNHLRTLGTIVFLDVDKEEILRRITDEDSRGIARPEGQTLDDVFQERLPLYHQYADLIYDNNQQTDITQLALDIRHYQTHTSP